MYWLSGVKDSGPFTQLLMVACSSDGMRCWAPSQICSIKCSWSSGSSEKAKSGGTPDVQIGFACASNPPTSSPVPHSSKVGVRIIVPVDRQSGMDAVHRICGDVKVRSQEERHGDTAAAPSSRDHRPAQSTTWSVSISWPSDVSTATTLLAPPPTDAVRKLATPTPSKMETPSWRGARGERHGEVGRRAATVARSHSPPTRSSVRSSPFIFSLHSLGVNSSASRP